MKYIEVDCLVAQPEACETLIALLSGAGFEGFTEHDRGFTAYIPEASFDAGAIRQLEQEGPVPFTFSQRIVEDENWNSIWESSFQPVTIGDFCHIRASFHPALPMVKHEIVIDPKMSFGTGHHETTRMMISLMSETEMSGKNLLDMGCGTGILAILAEKMGVASVTAADNDEWAFANCNENIRINSCENITVSLSDAALLDTMQNDTFDLVLANINLNVLLQDIPRYARVLKPEGNLMLSGFLQGDHEKISAACKQFSMQEIRFLTLNEWMAISFRKPISNNSQNHI